VADAESPGTDPLERVAAAWLDAGPVPEWHERLKTHLLRDWPTLGNALNDLTRVPGTRRTRLLSESQIRRDQALTDALTAGRAGRPDIGQAIIAPHAIMRAPSPDEPEHVHVMSYAGSYVGSNLNRAVYRCACGHQVVESAKPESESEADRG